MKPTEAPAVNLRPPFEIAFSPELKVRYGYRDAHVELEAKVPFLPLGKFKKAFTREEFKLGKNAFDKAKMWKDVPEFQRLRDAPAQPFVERLSDKIEMRYGFADAHAELIVTLIEEAEGGGLKAKFLGALSSKLPKEVRHSFSADEIGLAQDAFSKADSWSNLSEEERKKICG